MHTLTTDGRRILPRLSPELLALRSRILSTPIVPATEDAPWCLADDPAEVLAIVSDAEPELHAEGYGRPEGWSAERQGRAWAGMQEPAFLDRLDRAARFLSYLRDHHRDRVSTRRSSAGWAAIAEHVTGAPVGNGALVAAALALGLAVKPRAATAEAWLGLGESAFKLLPGVSPAAASRSSGGLALVAGSL